MKVIGAGLPRTATTTQLIALEMLGFPCYHMRDMMSDLTTSVPQWRKALHRMLIRVARREPRSASTARVPPVHALVLEGDP